MGLLRASRGMTAVAVITKAIHTRQQHQQQLQQLHRSTRPASLEGSAAVNPRGRRGGGDFRVQERGHGGGFAGRVRPPPPTCLQGHPCWDSHKTDEKLLGMYRSPSNTLSH